MVCLWLIRSFSDGGWLSHWSHEYFTTSCMPFVFHKKSSCCCILLTLVTWISYTSVYGIFVSLKVSLFIERYSTFSYPAPCYHLRDGFCLGSTISPFKNVIRPPASCYYFECSSKLIGVTNSFSHNWPLILPIF